MKRIRFFFFASLVIILLAAGCAAPSAPSHEQAGVPTQESEGRVEPAQLIQSEKARLENPQTTAADLESLRGGNRAFAMNLYKQLREKDGNLFVSPYSISLALAMTYAGARGETEAQMAQALRFDLPQARLHPAFNALSAELESRAEQAKDDEEGRLTLNIANSLWGQAGFAFQADFLDTLAQHYGAGMRTVDYARPEEARKMINDWVAEETREKIQDLIPSGVLTPLTRLVLTNAIYFKAAWRVPFDERLTSEGDFTLLNGETVQVEMMHQAEMLAYTGGDDFQAVELPYAGGSAAMVVLLPAPGHFAEFEAGLDAGRMEAILSDLEPRQVELSLPKFRVESSFSLKDALTTLGMPDAFDRDKADFSGMTGRADLYISEAVHKAYVNVDKAGTEAAAATAVIMTLKSMPLESVEVRVDRPFIFLILDRETGTILFMGRVLDPRQEG
jgi:serpin B